MTTGPAAADPAADEQTGRLVDAEQAPAERLHPIALLSGFGQAIRNMIGGIAAGGYFAFQGRLGTALLVLGAMAVVTLLGLVLHWWRFSFRVGADAIRIDSGLLNRNHRTIPFDRVADVSIAQGPVQRLVGIARVTLETGGGGGEDGVLDGIALGRAEALREFVRARRRGTGASTTDVPASAGTTDVAEASPLFAMDLPRVATLGLFNFSLALFAGLFGLTQTVGDVVGFDPFKRSFWRPILEQSGWGEWLLAHRIGLALGGLAMLVVAGVVTGMVRTVLREFGFRLDRTGNGFRRRRGLLTRTDVSLPLKRIQAAAIVTGPVRERFGWHALKVLSLAGESAGKNDNGQESKRDHVLAPLATVAEIAPVMNALRLHPARPETAWQPVSKAHVTSFLVAMLPLFPLLLVFGPLRWLEWKRTAFALEGEQLLIRTGWWQRRTLLLPLRNVQSVTLHENSLDRKFGIATLAIDVAGGRMGGQRVPSLPRKEASLLRQELLSRQP